MKINLIIFCLTLLIIYGLNVVGSPAQDKAIQFSAYPSEKVKASSITWNGHFGTKKEEPNNLFILMTQGGFRAPTSDNFENLIKSWVAEHPKADAVVVYKMDELRAGNPDSKLKAVWVVDGTENLNVYLVRNGGCPAGTMLLNRGDKTHLTREEYESFFKKVTEAEELAKKEKLGIWSSPK
jgi:hypothetical protein